MGFLRTKLRFILRMARPGFSMPPLDASPRSTRPPRWLASVAAILLVAFWLWKQGPPEQVPAPASQPEATEPARELCDELPAQEAVEDLLPTGTVSSKPNASVPHEDAGPRIEARPEAADSSLIVHQVTIKDQSGRVAFRGDVDLGPTLARIERGERHPHRNDGGTFRNLEGRLPKRPSGYYTEYVHPTPGLNGPGPQRVVLGRDGEVFYTSDHYQSFKKLR
jgi:ribonuclease T1